MKTAIRRTTAAFGLVILNASTIVGYAQFTYGTNFNGTLNLVRYTGTNPVVTIPSSDHGLTVASIGYGAFDSLAFLTSVTIPDSIVRVVGATFDGCTGLTNVTIPSSLTSLGDYMFGGCTSLSSFTIPSSVTDLATHAFDSCYALTNITLPNSLTSIGDNTFSYCSSLTRITIPASVVSIGNNVFSFCSKLSSIYFEGNAPSVTSDTFNHVRTLTVYCLAGTTGWDAFSSSTGLKTVLWQPSPTVQASIASVGLPSNQFTFSGVSPQLPCDVKDGELLLGEERHDNEIPVPLNVTASVQLRLVLDSIHTVTVKGHGVRLELLGEPRYVEEFNR